jgi:hypothetical protein
MPSPRQWIRIEAAGMSSPYEVPVRRPYVWRGDPPPLPAWLAQVRARTDAAIAAARQQQEDGDDDAAD